MFGFPTGLFGLPFAVGSAVPSDDAASLASRKKYGDMFRSAIRGFGAGQPAPGKELGADLPSTGSLFGNGLRFLQQHADPNPSAYNSGAQSFDESGFLPSAPSQAAAASAPAAASPSAAPGAFPADPYFDPASMGGNGQPMTLPPPAPATQVNPMVTGSVKAPLGSQLPGMQTQMPSFYNGPGSASFGAGDQAPGMGSGGGKGGGFNLASFFGGGNGQTDSSKPFNMDDFMSKAGTDSNGKDRKGLFWQFAKALHGFGNGGSDFFAPNDI